MNSIPESKQGASWLWQVLLITVAIVVAMTTLIRIPGAWSWGPLTWTSLAWWIVIAIIDGLVLRRGKLSLRRMTVVASILPILIMFPFRGISLSHERARWDNLMRKQTQPITQAGWGGWWKWHRLPDGNLVPKCLVWRASPQGMSMPHATINEQHLSLMPLSQELADQVQVISLDFGQRKAIPKDNIKILNQNLSQLRQLVSLRITGVYSKNSPGIELDRLPEQQGLVELKVWGGPPIQESLFKRLTISNKLEEFTIAYNTTDDQVVRDFKSHSDRLRLGLSGTRIQSDAIKTVVRNAPGIAAISIDSHQLDPELIRSLRPSPSGINIDVNGHSLRQEVIPHEPLEQVIHAFLKLNVDKSSNQSYLTFHRLRIEAIPEISTTPNMLVSFRECEFGYEAVRQIFGNRLTRYKNLDGEMRLSDLKQVVAESIDPVWRAKTTQAIAVIESKLPGGTVTVIPLPSTPLDTTVKVQASTIEMFPDRQNKEVIRFRFY